jgi:hypothetical protein
VSCRLDLIALDVPIAGDCGVCGHQGMHNHFDRVLGELVCTGDWAAVRDAEIQLRAWLQPGGELTIGELERRITEFERSATRRLSSQRFPWE